MVRWNCGLVFKLPSTSEYSDDREWFKAQIRPDAARTGQPSLRDIRSEQPRLVHMSQCHSMTFRADTSIRVE
jgi:hypothetical protein